MGRTLNTGIHHSEGRFTHGTMLASSRSHQWLAMNKLCIFIGVMVFSWMGWWLGAKIGTMTGFALSSIGSVVGVYVGWRINRDYLG